VELIVLPNSSINNLGQLNLANYDCVGVSGLNTYYGLNKIDSFPYVRTIETPDAK